MEDTTAKVINGEEKGNKRETTQERLHRLQKLDEELQRQQKNLTAPFRANGAAGGAAGQEVDRNQPGDPERETLGARQNPSLPVMSRSPAPPADSQVANNAGPAEDSENFGQQLEGEGSKNKGRKTADKNKREKESPGEDLDTFFQEYLEKVDVSGQGISVKLVDKNLALELNQLIYAYKIRAKNKNMKISLQLLMSAIIYKWLEDYEGDIRKLFM
ncbi:hypothetical protein V9K67_21480 [Paraflavisolibacter sp. H34]|uniref:hypothetical protein n=1 Tax=Huijunlia imazamoxiresistens TaxID=3127457 RepID=UPI003018A3D6